MNEATITALLPQYSYSEAFMERYLEAIHLENVPITRSPNTQAIKAVDGSELKADYLNYFIDNKQALEEEFFFDLSEKIGENKTLLFCGIIRKFWYDGRKKRRSRIVNSLKWGIRNYLQSIIRNNGIRNVVQNDISEPNRELFSADEITSILAVNDQNLYKHLHLWIEQRPMSTEISSDDVFFKRGLSCETLLEDGSQYKEWDFINSYSIAFSAPEQFSQMVDKNIPIIINADWNYYTNRVLFFSPFVKGMDAGQLELGIIPNSFSDVLHYQGEHGGIHEYLIGEHFSI